MEEEKKIYNKLILIIIFVIIVSLFGFSYNQSIFNNMYFENIDGKEGLSNSSISSIVQDRYGFLWFGTQNGLNRYDGKKFLVFNNEPFQKNTIPNQLIQTMYMDKNDILWIGTYNGLTRFNIKDGVFTTYANKTEDQESLSNNVAIAIERDREDNLWVGTLKGLQIFDEKNQKFKRFNFDSKELGPTKDTTIRDIYTDSSGNVWIGTYDGIYKYNKDKFVFYSAEYKFNDSEKYIKNSFIDSFESKFPASNAAMVIVEDKNGDIWFGVWGFGLCKYIAKKNIFINYPLPFNKIYSLLFIDEENLLVGTWGEGLFNFNIKESILDKVENKKLGIIIPNNTIYSLYKDKSGIIWIGTHGSGILKWVIDKPDLVYLKYNENIKNSIPNSKIKAIYEDRHGYIWFGTYNSGLIRFNPKNNELIQYLSNEKINGSLSDNIVRQVFQDSHGNLWIATNKYLNLYNYKTEKFKYFKKTDFGLEASSEETFTCITEDKNNNLLIGTYLSGMIIVPLADNEKQILDFNKAKIINTKTNPSISDDLVFDIDIDNNENIWIGTNKGLNLINFKSYEVKEFLYDENNPDGISNNAITDIYHDSKGRIWIGTSNGLNIYDYKLDKFTHITAKNGLPQNYINSIMEDSNGNIFFTTFSHLVKYNPSTSELVSFTYEYGLLTREFSSGVAKLKDNSILFGGIGIVNIIKNNQLNLSKFDPPIQIVSIKIQGKEYKENNLYYELNSIKLPYNKNSVSIEFVSLDYSSSASLLYSYKIDKLNKNWQYLGSNGLINLVNLKHGNYKIYLRGTNRDGLYGSQIKVLNLKINPPFYLTWWAFLIYFFILFSLGYLTVLFLREKALSQILIERKNLIEERKTFLENEIKKQKEIEQNLLNSKETLESLNEAKDTFIAQISHEFKNPLTLLLGYIQILDKNETDDIKKKMISNMLSISKHILDMITTILDMAKINLGKITVNPVKINIYEFSRNIADSFKILSEEKNLKFEFNFNNKIPENLIIDDLKVRQILNNILSNAIKYTEKGFIKFNVDFNEDEYQKEKKLTLRFDVIDSGIGLSEKEKEKIFDNFYRGQDSTKTEGTGLGLSISKKLTEIIGGQILVESEKGLGSKFTLLLNDVIVFE